MKVLLALVALGLLVASSASAQSIDKWQLRIYNAGAALPLSSTDLLVANVSCGLPAPLTGSTINPNKVGFDDAITVGRFCRWDDPLGPTSPLNSLPFGAASYDATLTAFSGPLVGPESLKATFTHPGFTPAAPTGLRVVR